ncbi:MAG TPA: signal peptidase II [Gaiellaceae bacterium]|nr:signal peptidase II [Gaiellaceae bacterium]
MRTDRRPDAVAVAGDGTGERLLGVLVAAVVLCAIDLQLNSVLTTPDWAYHHRSGAWIAACLLTLAGTAAATRVPSAAVAVGAGLLAGGVLGNLVSALVNGGSVPDPLLIGTHQGVAFNIADLFTLSGIVLVIGGLMAVVIVNRDRLPPPRRVERWLLRRVGL